MGRDNIRRRCARLDPARGNRWRHPVVRLVGEYLLGYLAAIRRAPLSPTDRWRCVKELSVWVARHASPVRKRGLPESTGPDAAVPTEPRRRPHV